MPDLADVPDLPDLPDGPRRLAATPGQTVGPFFHYALPYDRDHELVPPATPGAIRLHGVVYDGSGAPIPDALVEIRQGDRSGHVPQVEGALRRDGMVFAGWGRCATDPGGRYAFTTIEPGPSTLGGAAFFSVVVVARGLLDRLFTRAYLPGPHLDHDPFLASLPADRRGSLLTVREGDGALRFDLHLQGEAETVFLTFPGHRR